MGQKRGNPYHDPKTGRFTSAYGVSCYKPYNYEQGMTADEHLVVAEKNIKGLEKAIFNYREVHKESFANGGKMTAYHNEETGEYRFIMADSSAIDAHAARNIQTIVDPSTNTIAEKGNYVQDYNNRAFIDDCAPKEVRQAAVFDFMEKHKEKLSQKNVCMGIEHDYDDNTYIIGIYKRISDDHGEAAKADDIAYYNAESGDWVTTDKGKAPSTIDRSKYTKRETGKRDERDEWEKKHNVTNEDLKNWGMTREQWEANVKHDLEKERELAYRYEEI